MKRVNEAGEWKSEDLWLKKVRFLNEIDEKSSVLERNEGEEEGVFVFKNEDFFGNVVPGNLAGPSLGGMDESNNWDLDNINFDMYFSNEEGRRKGFDINIPMYSTENGGAENSYVELTQGPVIHDTRKIIIDIGSDNSDDDLEIIGFSSGYREKDKQIEFGMPCDATGLGDLSLGFGKSDVMGDSSSVTGDEIRYTREEKGKASVDDPWLSFIAIWSLGMDLPPNSKQPIKIDKPREHVEVVLPEPVPVAERVVINQDDGALRRRRILYQESLRASAKRFARTVNDSSSQKQKPPALEQLGNAPGPFSEALKMVRERTTKKESHQLIEWKPSEENRNKSITEPIVPSLLDLSLTGLADNADAIVSLTMVSDFLRRRLTDMLCDRSKMDVHILNLLAEGCPAEIRVKNCSWLTETQFLQTFGNCQTRSLKVLQLDLCGQCMYAFRDAFSRSSNNFSNLAIVSLRGASRLSDHDIKELVISAPALRSINLGQCALLTAETIDFIGYYLGSKLRELYIDGCPKIDAMLTLSAFTQLEYLEVLSVAGVQGITDQFISNMITVCGQSIKELDLANCLELTDWSLKTIGNSCAFLCSLNISNLNHLTDLGLENLANGCRSIQKLKFCRNGFSDEAMAAFVESSGEFLVELLLNNMTEVGPNTALAIAKRSRKLLSLDISWCRRISDVALGLIVDSCSSLKLLKVFGCRQITKVFVNGHSNGMVRIIGLDMIPILDHLNLLEPDEVFLRYSPLPICP